MQVAKILSVKGHDVTKTGPDTSVSEALAILAEKRIGVVVIAGADDALLGILSERDIVRALAERGHDALEAPVSDFMTSELITCTLNRGTEDLMRDMTTHRIRHLPVVEDGKLVGMISIGDVVKHRLEELQMERDALQDYIATG